MGGSTYLSPDGGFTIGTKVALVAARSASSSLQRSFSDAGNGREEFEEMLHGSGDTDWQTAAFAR